ncbi:hypothetical protein [Nocardioides sp. SYSU DS0663]|uniref:hypothetical protein n=1 Tax=Nocardioides sp. SYSU DS0663 TaxID=3416445 RepID=UPI003F4C2831
MAWEQELFGLLEDLEQQAEAAYDAERAAELADRSRAEYQQVTLASRLVASIGTELALEVRGVGTLAGSLERVADGWCLLHGRGQDWVVRLAAVLAVHAASDRSVPELAWPVTARLGLRSALRRLADLSARCVWHTVDGGRYEGVVTRVGSDFAEVRVGEAHRVVLLPFDALAAVQSRED